MTLIPFLAAAMAAGQLTAAYLVAPPDTAFPGASADCSAWVYATESLTCEEIESTHGIILTEFAAWVPSPFFLYFLSTRTLTLH
ncbi:hypothetical protein BDV10DRAFT_175607 [Aspergillus recurvatus]